MEKIKIQSEEKHFFEYLKNICPLYGTFGKRAYLNEDKNFIKEDIKFLIIDENLKVIYEHKPYLKGNYYPVVQKKVDKIKNNWPVFENADEKMRWGIEASRTDDSIEDLIANLRTDVFLKWLHPDREKKELFDIEPSSKEFQELEFVINCHNKRTKPNSESSYDKRDIDYEDYTEIGKKKINNCIEWFKTNNSKTPVQDAWLKVLKKNGIKVDWIPYERWCEVPVMKNINYASKEELGIQRKKKDEEFKKSLSPELKAQMRKLAESLKLK